MNAVYNGWSWSRRRVVAVFAGLLMFALLAGGAGGYLIRGATTLAAQQTISANPAPQRAATGHLSVNPLSRAINGDSRSGYSTTAHGNRPPQVLNMDSKSGY